MGKTIPVRKELEEKKKQTMVGTGDSSQQPIAELKPWLTNRGKSFPKLKFPDFDGSNLDDWVYMSERYFELEETAESVKVRIAAVYMYDEAFQWHFTYIRTRGRADMLMWAEYVDALRERFGKPAVGDPMERLKNRRREGTYDNLSVYREEYGDCSRKVLEMGELPEESGDGSGRRCKERRGHSRAERKKKEMRSSEKKKDRERRESKEMKGRRNREGNRRSSRTRKRRRKHRRDYWSEEEDNRFGLCSVGIKVGPLVVGEDVSDGSCDEFMFTEFDQLKEYCLLQQARPELSSVPIKRASSVEIYVENGGRVRGIWMGMLATRKFRQKRKKVEVFKDAANKTDQNNWGRLMNEIEEVGTTVEVLRTKRVNNQALPRELVLGTLKRFKQWKGLNLVSEIIERLRVQSWWNTSKMNLRMLITAYGKQGDFNSAERVMSYMNKKSYPPSVISHTAFRESYGRGKRYKNAKVIFRRRQSSGPEPSALTYQIILKTFVESNQVKEAEEVFETLLNSEKFTLKPDQKMFHMMTYMHKKAGIYEKAHREFSLMAERGVEQSTVTYNRLMSFETNYKEVSKIYEQMQRAGLRPNVVSYASLVNAYRKARREDEALAIFEEMLTAGVGSTQKTYNILLDAFSI